MGNMQQMMKQAQKLQKQMMDAQEQLNQQEFTGKSTNEYVTTTFTGNRQMKNLEINEAIIDPEDADMLSDMVLMAVNDALTQIEDANEKTMGKYTKGLPF